MSHNNQRQYHYDLYIKNHLNMCEWFNKRGYDDGHYQGYHNGYNPYNIINKVVIENQWLLCEDYKYSYNNGFDNGYNEGYKQGLEKWYNEYNQSLQYDLINNNNTIAKAIPLSVMKSVDIDTLEPEIMYVEKPT